MGLVIYIAAETMRQATNRSIDWNSLISDGNYALWRAAERFNPAKSREGNFHPFAAEYIRRAVKRAARGKRFPQTGLDLDRIPAIRRPPSLVPLFPITALDPQSVCPHRGKIERGSIFCCMVCHCSGQDHHPAMQIGPLDIRKPEKPKPKLDQLVAAVLKENRRQRRLRLFGPPKVSA